MQLFWGDVIDNQVVLKGDDARHCTKVLRKKMGDIIEVINGSGSLFICRITHITKAEVWAKVESETLNFGAIPYQLTLAVAPTKNMDRLEWLLEKATEMGITAFVPILTAHAERKHLKLDRLQRIAIAAAKQSYKGKIPDIQSLTKFKDFINTADSTTKLIAHCYDEKRFALRDKLAQNQSITICIGPEGDFSPEEIKMAQTAGFESISLGQSRLRTETAALVAVASVYQALGDLS